MRADFFNEPLVTALFAACTPADAATDTTEAAEDITRADVLRNRLILQLDQADRAAVQAGISREGVQAADLAVCAFVDETLLCSSTWPGRSEWQLQPLQFVRHRTASAGEEFYRLLDALLAEEESRPLWQESEKPRPAQLVLEVFAICLAQGFTGMYYDDAAAIEARLNKIARLLPAVAVQSAVTMQPASHTKKNSLQYSMYRMRGLDKLDWCLWIIPPVVTALFYWACRAKLNTLLEPFLTGTVS